MLDPSLIHPGLIGSSSLVVAAEHTAPRVGSGRIAVLATPVMINVIEAAALAAMEHLLPEGHQSLGIRLDVRHFAATPVGLTVTATAEVTRVEGRTIPSASRPATSARRSATARTSAWSSTWRDSTTGCSARCAASRHRPAVVRSMSTWNAAGAIAKSWNALYSRRAKRQFHGCPQPPGARHAGRLSQSRPATAAA